VCYGLNFLGGFEKSIKNAKLSYWLKSKKFKFKKVITLLYNDSTFGGKKSTKALENILNHMLLMAKSKNFIHYRQEISCQNVGFLNTDNFEPHTLPII
jgi:hypothetical protein